MDKPICILAVGYLSHRSRHTQVPVPMTIVGVLPPDVMADVRFDLQNLENSRRILYFCR